MCARCHNLCEFCTSPGVPGKLCFFGFIHHFLFLQTFCLLFLIQVFYYYLYFIKTKNQNWDYDYKTLETQWGGGVMPIVCKGLGSISCSKKERSDMVEGAQNKWQKWNKCNVNEVKGISDHYQNQDWTCRYQDLWLRNGRTNDFMLGSLWC